MKPLELKTPKHLNHSMGGTFHYDEKGNFVKHEPPTKPLPPGVNPNAGEVAMSDAAEADAVAETMSAKRGKTQE